MPIYAWAQSCAARHGNQGNKKTGVSRFFYCPSICQRINTWRINTLAIRERYLSKSAGEKKPARKPVFFAKLITSKQQEQQRLELEQQRPKQQEQQQLEQQ